MTPRNLANGGGYRYRRVRPNAGSIAAVGITNQRETTVVWDRTTGEPVTPSCSAAEPPICNALKDHEASSPKNGAPRRVFQRYQTRHILIIPDRANLAWHDHLAHL